MVKALLFCAQSYTFSMIIVLFYKKKILDMVENNVLNRKLKYQFYFFARLMSFLLRSLAP